ncbi:MAG: UDP-N-acetylmuramate dehydrogenase [Anaerolineae bacterium]
MERPRGDATAESNLAALAEALGPSARRGMPMADFTSMRVGGPADLLVVAESIPEVVRSVELARQHGVVCRAIGGGCNVLVADQGLRGLVVVNRADSISFEDERVLAESGARLAVLAQGAVERGLDGLAWAAGLPGTVGGAVVGNAGAFGGDIAQVLHSATVLAPEGRVEEKANDWFEFSYRGSRIKRKGTSAQQGDRCESIVVITVSFELERGDAEDLRVRADDILTWRRLRHPSGATMGSTFKNPADHHAGRLIEAAGLKGYRIGGAEISEQHANFLTNVGGATAADVMALIEHAQTEVARQFGISLELEIELLGWSVSRSRRGR